MYLCQIRVEKNAETHYFVVDEWEKPAGWAHLGQPSESAAKHQLFVLNLKSRALRASWLVIGGLIFTFQTEKEKRRRHWGRGVYKRDMCWLDPQVLQQRETGQEVQLCVYMHVCGGVVSKQRYWKHAKRKNKQTRRPKHLFFFLPVCQNLNGW